jgi:hypothetical protein
MTVRSFEGATGKSETKQYSKYYDAGDWAIRGKLGMSVVVDHEKKTIPVIHGAKQFLGALGPDDTEATGKVTIYLWNGSETEYSVGIQEVISRDNIRKMSTPPLKVEPKSRPGVEIGQIAISNYGLEIPMTVNYQIDGKSYSTSFNLKRRTVDELRIFFGPGGSPPYPWYDEKGSRP